MYILYVLPACLTTCLFVYAGLTWSGACSPILRQAGDRAHYDLSQTYALSPRSLKKSWTLNRIPSGSDDIKTGSNVIKSVDAVRNLGVMLDSQLSMHEHVSRTIGACFFQLRRLRSIRHLLGRDVAIGWS